MSKTLAGFTMILTAMLQTGWARAQSEVSLPSSVKIVWDREKAWHEITPTRERVCLNGLWCWQPGKADAEAVPAGSWGAFKVPAAWPGRGDYMMKDSMSLFRHDSWKDVNLGAVSAAWYQREFCIPKEWAGRKIVLQASYLNSFATVFIDGKKTGHLYFPAGDLDITAACANGEKHVVSMLVVAIPLNTVMKSYGDSNAPKDVKDVHVAQRGLCGDVFIMGFPAAASVAEVKIDTSVRSGEISLDSKFNALDTAGEYSLRVQIAEKDKTVKEFTTKPFKGADAKNGHIATVEKWKAEKLWDVHTPQNTYQLQLTLLDSNGKALDTYFSQRFAYREMWIDGRDFYLNGSRIFLSAIPVDNASSSVACSTYEAARETFLRMKTFGINFVYTHNYGCQPGDHLSFDELLRAADDTGMLVSLSQPHFGHYSWDAADADESNGYVRHAEFYCRVAGNHPSVVCYSTSHNACGYNDDMNPDLIDGIYQNLNQWSVAAQKKALRAEAIIKRIDPARFVYHHSSGNLGSMHTSNFYPNWTPIQELSDWYEHWATKGVKPMFMCEYGAPFTWDFAMYRGYYGTDPKSGKPIRNFGSASCPWEFCMAEWDAQFYGDRAFKCSELEKECLRFETRNLKSGKTGWHRWDYPQECLGSTAPADRLGVLAAYYTDNFRSYRTWGVSAISPWEHHVLFDKREGVSRDRKEFKVDWDNLQRPGYSPDFTEGRYEAMHMAYERSDWTPNVAGQAVIRSNMPLLAYIGGKAAAFTSKDHNFLAGESFEKQLIIINNSRETVSCECSWSLGLVKPIAGTKTVSIKTGEQERIPLRFELPADTAAGAHEISATVKFSNGETQKDNFAIHVMPKPQAAKTSGKIALFDPKGETAKWLGTMGVTAQTVDATADLSAVETLIIGKAALTVGGAAPDVTRVRDGLRVVIFEQEPDVLEQRFGFRIDEYGLRNVYKRTPDHPILAGIDTENLRDWKGEATIVPPRRKVANSDNYHGLPTVKWCGMDMTHIWRCGNRGAVASVLIEKPACGDFLPLIDGGYSLQYSPLMEYREGKGLVLFCQLDVTGRTESDPAGETIGRNILQYVSNWKPAPARRLVYAGDAAGKAHLEKCGFTFAPYDGGTLAPDQVLLAAPGSGQSLSSHATQIAASLKSGGKLLAMGLDENEANPLLPSKVSMKKAEHICAFFEPPALNTTLAGIGPADVHNREPRELPLVTGGATVLGDGVLARAEGADAVICQMVPWQFEYKNPQNAKRTFRRASFTLTRLLSNMGVASNVPLLSNVKTAADEKNDKRWLSGLYLDQPETWDNPYRFFRW
jgi:hypothetical protein